jgi:hypothetical protein
VLALFCGLVLLALPLRAETRQSVYWAGFAFTGEYASRHSLTPYSAAILEKRGLLSLNRALYSALQAQPPAHLTLIGDTLAHLDGTTSATVLAATLDRELVSVEPIDGRYKLLVELALQALFFDYRERQIIASWPVTLQYIDLVDTLPDKATIAAHVTELLYGDASASLAQVLPQTLAQARLPEAAMKRIQVSAVEIADAAHAALPPPGRDTQFRGLRQTLAHEFSKLFSTQTGIGLLPAAHGEAFGATMAARFADGRVFQLSIPAADYQMHLRLDRFASRVHEETSTVQTLLFGAFFTVTVLEPFSGTVIFEQPLRKGATKTVPATQTGVDAWPAYYETLLSGLAAFADAAANRYGARDWLAQQKPGGAALERQIFSLQELIASCR